MIPRFQFATPAPSSQRSSNNQRNNSHSSSSLSCSLQSRSSRASTSESRQQQSLSRIYNNSNNNINTITMASVGGVSTLATSFSGSYMSIYDTDLANVIEQSDQTIGLLDVVRGNAQLYSDESTVSTSSRYRFINLKNKMDASDDAEIFHNHCQNGDLYQITRMLTAKNGKFILSRKFRYAFPLFTAIHFNQYEVVKELLRNGACPFEFGYEENHTDDNQYNRNIQRGLFSDGEHNIEISCLYEAVRVQNLEIVKLLLEQYSKHPSQKLSRGRKLSPYHANQVMKESPLYLACRLGNLSIISEFFNSTYQLLPRIDFFHGSSLYSKSIILTLFHAVGDVGGKNLLEQEIASTNIMKLLAPMYKLQRVQLLERRATRISALDYSPNIDAISSVNYLKPYSDEFSIHSCLNISKVKIATRFSNFVVNSPLYLAIYNENDTLTRYLLSNHLSMIDISLGEIGKAQTKFSLAHPFKETCLYIAIIKRSLHAVIALLRAHPNIYMDEELENYRQLSFQEGFHFDKMIDIALYFSNNMKRVVNSNIFSDIQLVSMDIPLSFYF
ncbi:hypothetical protein C9374_005582 [Naegleria lovaniensis]|uniref:Uncharacterized protein n=1 Tax=Naegleria lovaniensis TaxID=51637 RepID=A0AA88GQT0_NAELO|nr:uncharacterized protein C9374_005582 [Naegleria lovaniensis]KAG2382380.1 hypothetical protein C9374_005582 [Naegleria lovaniensis]